MEDNTVKRRSVSFPTQLLVNVSDLLEKRGSKRVGRGKYSANDFVVDAVREKYERELAKKEV